MVHLRSSRPSCLEQVRRRFRVDARGARSSRIAWPELVSDLVDATRPRMVKLAVTGRFCELYQAREFLRGELTPLNTSGTYAIDNDRRRRHALA